MTIFYIVIGSIIAVLALVTWAACTAGAWADRRAEEVMCDCTCEERPVFDEKGWQVAGSNGQGAGFSFPAFFPTSHEGVCIFCGGRVIGGPPLSAQAEESRACACEKKESDGR